MTEFRCLTPILCVKDIEASFAYYVDRLGFEKKWDWPEESPNKTFGCVARGHIEIFLAQGGQGQPGTWMSIFVDNVDDLYEEYQKRGATIKQKPTNFPWGCREMNVEDLDGHRLRMTSEATGPAEATSHAP